MAEELRNINTGIDPWYIDNPNSIGPSISSQKNPAKKSSKITTEADRLQKKIDSLKMAQEQLRLFSLNQGGDLQANFVTKPIDSYNEEDLIISRLNPEIYKQSQKYDNITQQINQLEKEKVNLARAQELLFGAASGFESSINKQADESKRSLALQKAMQLGAAKGTAGKQGATAGQMEMIQSDIANKYGPQSANIEAQRQQGLGTAAQLTAQIPQTLSALGGQDVVNEFNKAQAAYYNKMAGIPDWRGIQRKDTLEIGDSEKTFSDIPGTFN